MKDLMESEVFCCGVVAGIGLHQQKVVNAAENKEALKIGDELYYVQNGRDRLKEMLDKVCR